ncbi:bifunctional PIG-L family deacetylase/class I SAM-dependent methyltransferase [Paeniglutamicibacter antarcticus]|uniref:Bifunctional PIG-L family deacetylase/class I SAM-dependent methyltransferase n=1 Tax=Arthrobacter terrae TaxID=2935737 RepID=A0A931CS88_9MICC|nr:bifunctional PIG-L family deacetylase/class I SAM-dependent methyltransferase [Arthrobacter terrae]MBG0739951.1 bifunctional PIG-L family deacetylase/class I SAM-dependent methyltransferase [Arthrobacter terrae]
MVTFNHLDDGTAEGVWRGSERLGATPELNLRLPRFTKLVLVSAHPDDETLAAAGLLQRASRHGLEVRLLVATDGEASHPDSSTHTPAQLAAIRGSELDHAMGTLAPAAKIRRLGLPDGRVADSRELLKQAILAECADAPDPAGAGAAAAEAEQGQTLIVAPWRADGHTDHDAAGEAAAAAAAESGSTFLEYPVWLWHWGTPDSSRVPWSSMRRLTLAATDIAGKERAITCHFSQNSPLSDLPGDETLLSPEMISHFRRPYEIFIDAAGSMMPDGDERVKWAQAQFDAVHQDLAEPWAAPEAWYEERKRLLTIAALPAREYASALEIGCSTGVLTRDLAQRCRRILAVDLSEEAVKTAARRNADLPGVKTMQLAVPGQWPTDSFDLIALSEVGYYLDRGTLLKTLDLMLGSLAPAGTLVACHWRHQITGWPLDGDAVHDFLRSDGRLKTRGIYTEEDFILEVFTVVQDGP